MIKVVLRLHDCFFGGKGITEVDENAAFRIDQLAYYYQMELSIHCKNQYSRNIKTFAGKYHIDLLDKNMLHICAYENGDFAAGSEGLQDGDPEPSREDVLRGAGSFVIDITFSNVKRL